MDLSRISMNKPTLLEELSALETIFRERAELIPRGEGEGHDRYRAGWKTAMQHAESVVRSRKEVHKNDHIG